MFVQTLKLHFILLCRIVWGIGVLRLLFLAVLTAFLGACLFISAQQFLFPAVLAVILYCIHNYRNDKQLLVLLFERSIIKLYWLEYAIISAPFWTASVIKCYFIDFLCHIPVLLFIPMLQTVRIKSVYLSNPFFRKGSYEYQSQFRRIYPVVFAFYTLAFIGLWVKNDALFYFAYGLLGLPFVFSILNPESPNYIINYMCVKDMFKHKLTGILYNNMTLYLPVWCAAMLMNSGLWSNMLWMFGLVTLLAFASCLLRYAFPSASIAGILFLFLLLPIFISPLIDKTFFILPVLTSIFLLFRAKDKLSNIFYYAANK